MGYESTRAKITYLVDSQNFTLNKWGISEFYFGNEMLKLFTCPTPYVRYTPFQDITSNNKFREKSGGTEELGSIFETSFIMPYEEDGSAKEKNIISVISLTNKAMNIERMYDDVYKGNPTYSGEYAAYKINHGNAVDFVVKRILLNGIGGYNPNFDGWNMRFKSGSIVFEFPGGNEFAFARYVNQSGKWVLDETRKLNIVDKTIDQINQNVTVGNNETVSPNKYIHLVNNITVTVNGDANLNGKTFKMGNNSKIRFISGNPDLTNLIIESNTPSDNYYIELGASYPLILSSNEKMIIGGKANLTGYRIQVNQGGELEIKDGSTVTLTDSFQFYNSGTTKIGSGVTMQLKNLTSYSSGNLLINQNSGTQTTLNISANGVINIQGLATVKKTDFIKSGTSNFSHVSITGNQAKSFENTHIEGSQYGFLVNNVATSNQVLFKNVTGMNNYYATIKASNSYFYIDGFEGIGAIQDGLGAYSGSIITLVGNVNVTSNLLGLRSAYNSNISFISDGNSSANVRMNTRGIQAYTDSRIDLYGGELSLWGNTRVDNLYGGISRFDLHVSDNSDIFIIGELDGIHGLTEFKEAGSTITIENQNEGGVHKASGEKEELANSDKHAPSLTKKAFMNAFWNATKAVNKQAVKDVLKDNIANSKQEIRSKAIALEILNLAQAGDFSWVNTFNKRAKLHSFVEDDALLIAEQQFYYATQTQPDEQEAQYWLEQLKAMNHEAVATGLFDVLFEQAEFTKTSGDSDDEKDKKWTSKQTLDIAAYPNPFNPTTSLKFTLKESAMVNIQVYDIMGRLVQTLTNTQWQSGVHTVSFDASKLASGLYFARTQLLQSGVLVDQSITKLMLVK